MKPHASTVMRRTEIDLHLSLLRKWLLKGHELHLIYFMALGLYAVWLKKIFNCLQLVKFVKIWHIFKHKTLVAIYL